MPQLLIQLSDGTQLVQELTGVVTIGRNPSNLLTLDEASVSSHHAKIDIGNNGVFLTDLFSSNGTFVNGERIMTQKLEEGDRVLLGKVECLFSNSA
jgi:pSer/pThr/pTyr-binding forkhead associated (FHA) protein